MEETKTLKDEFRELKEIIQESQPKKKEKIPRLPLKGKVGNNKASKGYIAVWKINENGFITPSREQIKEQTVMIDGVPRLAAPEYILRYKKGFRTIPIIIMPSWSVNPYSPTKSYETSLEDGSNTKGYQLLMNRMKNETVGMKKAVGGFIKWIVGLGLAGIIIYAIFTSGGG